MRLVTAFDLIVASTSTDASSARIILLAFGDHVHPLTERLRPDDLSDTRLPLRSRASLT